MAATPSVAELIDLIRKQGTAIVKLSERLARLREDFDTLVKELNTVGSETGEDDDGDGD